MLSFHNLGTTVFYFIGGKKRYLWSLLMREFDALLSSLNIILCLSYISTRTQNCPRMRFFVAYRIGLKEIKKNARNNGRFFCDGPLKRENRIHIIWWCIKKWWKTQNNISKFFSRVKNFEHSPITLWFSSFVLFSPPAKKETFSFSFDLIFF